MTANTVHTRPRRMILPTLTTGLLIGLIQSIVAVSLGSLVFAGPLAGDLSRGVAMALATTSISAIVLALFSTARGAIATTQSSPLVVLAVAVSGIAVTLDGSPALLPTVVVTLVLATVGTGIILWLIGRFGLSELVRYLPYPIMGGFLAGTGLLLVRGAIRVMADTNLSLAVMPQLLVGDLLLQWVPGMVFGFALFLVMRRYQHISVLPIMLLVGLASFYGVIALMGLSLTDAAAAGLLIGDMAPLSGPQFFDPQDLNRVDWGAIQAQLGNLAVIAVLTPIVLLLNISSIELLEHEYLDLNRELRLVGWASVLSAFAGGMIGFHSLSMTTLSHRMRIYNRGVGIIVGLVHLGILFTGAQLMVYVPRMMMGGLLAYLGFNFIYDWAIDRYRTLSQLDYAVMLFIALTIVVAGFLTGIVLGLGIMVMIFVITYSRTSIFYREDTAERIPSNVDRTANHERALTKMRSSIYIQELQGFIFFGTATSILNRVRARVADDDPFEFLVVDFQRVTGLDSSALFSFIRLRQLLDSHEIALVFTHLPDDILRDFQTNGIVPADASCVFPDLDYGVEWCEEILLSKNPVTASNIPVTLASQLNALGFEKALTKRLKTYMERVSFKPGETVIEQGRLGDRMYFIELGQVTITLSHAGGLHKRVRKKNMGTVVGEVAFFLASARSASVEATLDTVAYVLDRTNFERMKTEDPDLVHAFNELMIRMIADRLVTTNEELLTLVD
jgi:SulP family sulfate permease